MAKRNLPKEHHCLRCRHVLYDSVGSSVGERVKVNIHLHFVLRYGYLLKVCVSFGQFCPATMWALKIIPCSSLVLCPDGVTASSSITGKPLYVVFFRTSTMRDTFSTPRRLTNGGFTSASSPTVTFLIQGSGFASRKGRPLSSTAHGKAKQSPICRTHKNDRQEESRWHSNAKVVGQTDEGRDESHFVQLTRKGRPYMQTENSMNALSTTTTTAVLKKVLQRRALLHQVATSSKAKRTPPTGARNAAQTPAEAPQVIRSLLSLSLFMSLSQRHLRRYLSVPPCPSKEAMQVSRFEPNIHMIHMERGFRLHTHEINKNRNNADQAKTNLGGWMQMI
ncbi:hypothetical protein Cgig2_005549 [Carnegiea gigantea]|uniref:Uncharacterized protein n=1 Tax=Carnegiea gigantea TaxID=171969 RepID=A0A9Q1KUB4_9CARY|nr:hypothetical protein Cgig2_005549 [Carnegiea gigantea]